MGRGHWRLVAVLAVVGLGCPSDPGPCVDWADPTLSYTVHLLEQTSTHSIPGDALASCGGTSLVAQTGDLLEMDLWGAGSSSGCTEFGPVFPRADLDIVDGPQVGVVLGGADGLGTFMLVNLSDCQVGLHLSLVPYLGTDASPRSDFVLVRRAEAHSWRCIPPEFPAVESGCADTWFVKITDENGRVVTRHPDGGT